MRVCAQSSNREALGKAERKANPDQETTVGIELVGRGFTDGCMDLYGQVRWGDPSSPDPGIKRVRDPRGRELGKGDSRARPRMRLENMLLDL